MSRARYGSSAGFGVWAFKQRNRHRHPQHQRTHYNGNRRCSAVPNFNAGDRKWLCCCETHVVYATKIACVVETTVMAAVTLVALVVLASSPHSFNLLQAYADPLIYTDACALLAKSAVQSVTLCLMMTGVWRGNRWLLLPHFMLRVLLCFITLILNMTLQLKQLGLTVTSSVILLECVFLAVPIRLWQYLTERDMDILYWTRVKAAKNHKNYISTSSDAAAEPMVGSDTCDTLSSHAPDSTGRRASQEEGIMISDLNPYYKKLYTTTGKTLIIPRDPQAEAAEAERADNARQGLHRALMLERMCHMSTVDEDSQPGSRQPSMLDIKQQQSVSRQNTVRSSEGADIDEEPLAESHSYPAEVDNLFGNGGGEYTVVPLTVSAPGALKESTDDEPSQTTVVSADRRPSLASLASTSRDRATSIASTASRYSNAVEQTGSAAPSLSLTSRRSSRDSTNSIGRLAGSRRGSGVAEAINAAQVSGLFENSTGPRRPSDADRTGMPPIDIYAHFASR